ncbi:hypothetical protein [Clostridium sp. C8-1-8]|uniref:hypothetical protein n=1 Tax=Clostridium sp. C8-1-8 TaxID=2698831 RepID=UPI00136FE5EF|nr:hypothetical protein [Clostridium sp. C8-1-8]
MHSYYGHNIAIMNGKRYKKVLFLIINLDEDIPKNYTIDPGVIQCIIIKTSNYYRIIDKNIFSKCRHLQNIIIIKHEATNFIINNVVTDNDIERINKILV